ncbi:CFEM domain-containing protein [Diaporthe helianthi]|uniref:CFEM domain-containing protein n=1 Tax=Diaporthe helianthi TaxID=158607 RepID=A0A2P5HUL6_DIAHE|nr:CFEM domain-containing protein [Diaporthe helianthi]
MRSISTAFLVLFGIQTVFFIIRMLSRVLKLITWGMDDMTIIVAFLATIGVITGRQLQLKAGMGQDIWTLTKDEIHDYLKLFWVFAFIYTITITLVKASICFLYLRLFTDRKFRRIVWATHAFNSALMITFIFAYAFQCNPPEYFWTMWEGQGVQHGHCVSYAVLSWTQAAIGIVLDLWMLALPLWQVTKLKLPFKKRMDAFMMFGCGIFLTIVSILRLECLVTLTKGHNPTKDLTWLATWANVEIAVGIIIACLPSTRLVILRYLPKKIKAQIQTTRTTTSSHTPRSSKFGSTATWVSVLSGKRESTAQPAVPLSETPHNADRDFNKQVSGSSPRRPNEVLIHPGASVSVASGLERRDSELPLVPGFESSRPAPLAAQSFAGGDEAPPVPSPLAKDRRIWVEQHIHVSNDPVTKFSTHISHGSPKDDDDSLPPWVPRLPDHERAEDESV